MPPPCTRRRALTALATTAGAGLAGCLGRPVGGGGMPIAAPAPVDVSFTAVVQRSFTSEHPARIRVALTNGADEGFAMTVSHGIEGPLSAIEGERAVGDATLVLLADPPGDDHETPPGAPCSSGEYAIPDERADGCWRPACEIPRVSAHYAIPVAAGETLAWPYVVLDGFNDTCLPPGTYAFEERAPIALGGDARGATPAGGTTHYLHKRLTVELAGDGTIAVDATVESRSVDDSWETEAADQTTPRQADG